MCFFLRLVVIVMIFFRFVLVWEYGVSIVFELRKNRVEGRLVVGWEDSSV